MNAPRHALRALALATALFALPAAAADSAAAAPVPEAGVALGRYRGVLQLPGGDLPFGLELAREGSAEVGYLLNGPERVRLADVTVRGFHLEILMPGFMNRLVADAVGGELRGELDVVRLHGVHQHIPFTARLGERYRFFRATSARRARLAGRWAVEFADDAGGVEQGVGEFSQAGDVVTGTFLAETGDHRYLEGQVRGDALYLSTFDGAHVYLYHARLTPAGELRGELWSGLAGHERWSARRDAAAALPDAYALTRMKPGIERFSVRFPDAAGQTVSTDDARFRGKVLIVALGGSWCPNCHDEAAFLEPLYREYRAKGVEIVELMFERFGDFAQAAAAAERFRRRYGIEYTMLIAGIADKDDAAQKLPMLDRVYAFPTTIFVDRTGRVRKIHTGFSGPATGDHYARLTAEFRANLDELLKGS